MQTAQRIFISYRRSDSQSQANGLNDGLRNRLPGAQIFMDIDSIPPGADFEEHIRHEIARCDVVLVLIGDEWLATPPGSDVRRIDEPQDFVRLEVESALESRDVRVIPVLVEGARMPGPSDLPTDISRLARLNAFELSDTRWTKDIETLSGLLRGSLVGEPTPGPAEATVTFADLDLDAVKYAVAGLPRQFATKDVSMHPAMLATHEDVASRSNYHTMVGRFLMQNRTALGLGSPDAPQGDDRGSRWTKVGVASAPAPGPTHRPVQTSAPAPAPTFGSPAGAPQTWYPTPPAQHRPMGGQRRAGLWVILLPFFSIGILSFIPPLWFAGKLGHDPDRRRRMRLMAAALGGAIVLAFILINVSPTDASGSPTGPASDLGALVTFVCWVTGVVLGVRIRKR